MLFIIGRKKLDIYINDSINKYVISELNKERALLNEYLGKISLLEDQNRHLSNEINRMRNLIEAGVKVEVDANKISRIVKNEIDGQLPEIANTLAERINAKNQKTLNNDSYIRKIVREELEKNNSAKLQDSNKQIDKRQLFFEVTNYVNQALSKYSNSLASEVLTSNKKVTELQSMLNQKNDENAALENKIRKQEADILALNNTISLMKSNLDKLTERIDKLIAGNVPPEKVSEKSYLVFSDDFLLNNNYLQNIIEQTKLLRDKITKLLYGKQDIEIYFKLLDKCINKMEQLLSKNQDGAVEPEKIAHECSKIFKQTVVKAMGQEKLRTVLEEYMASCNLKKLNWNIGQKLKDEDYDYLDEPILYQEVEDKNLDGTICAIKQNTYIIEYIEDDERYEAIIPGVYCIGKYKK